MIIADDLTVVTGAVGVFNVGAVIDRNTNAPELAGVLTARVTRGFTSAGAATAQYRVVTDDTNPPGATPVVHASGPVLSLSALQVGKQLVCAPLANLMDAKRYLGLQQISGVAPLLTGAIDAEATLGSLSLETRQGPRVSLTSLFFLIDDNGYIVGYRNPKTDSNEYDWFTLAAT